MYFGHSPVGLKDSVQQEVRSYVCRIFSVVLDPSVYICNRCHSLRDPLVTSDIAMFAGNVKWRKSVFDATGAPWQQTVDALLSNTAERSTTVTLVFERETPDDAPTGAPTTEPAV
jgi:hypothetical protein